MPNHVTTICIVTGDEDQVDRFKREIFGSNEPEQLFDFNRIVPMPPILRKANSGSVAEWGAQLILYRAGNKVSYFGDEVAIPANQWERIRQEASVIRPDIVHAGDVAAVYLDANPNYEEEGMDSLRAIVETGFASWYEWSLQKWGTKWGAYDVERRLDVGEGFSFKFETAWSFPTPIFAALVARYPELTFDLSCFDEGWNFAGEGQLGAIVHTPFALSKEAATDELYERVYGEAPVHEDA